MNKKSTMRCGSITLKRVLTDEEMNELGQAFSATGVSYSTPLGYGIKSHLIYAPKGAEFLACNEL